MKRGMGNKKLVWGIVIVLILVAIVVFVLIEKKEPEANPIDVQCKFACDNNQRTAFCFVERKVTNKLTATCDELSTNPLYAEYNVEVCPAVSCKAQQETGAEDQTCVTGLGGTWEFPDAEGNCPQTGIKIVRKLTPSDNPPIQGQICCR